MTQRHASEQMFLEKQHLQTWCRVATNPQFVGKKKKSLSTELNKVKHNKIKACLYYENDDIPVGFAKIRLNRLNTLIQNKQYKGSKSGKQSLF